MCFPVFFKFLYNKDFFYNLKCCIYLKCFQFLTMSFFFFLYHKVWNLAEPFTYNNLIESDLLLSFILSHCVPWHGYSEDSPVAGLLKQAAGLHVCLSFPGHGEPRPGCHRGNFRLFSLCCCFVIVIVLFCFEFPFSAISWEAEIREVRGAK